MSNRSRLRAFRALPAAERALALRAAAALVVARVQARWLALPRLRRALAQPAGGMADRAAALAVRRAIARAARALPSSSCLVQAVAAARMLRARGLPAELTIGVAPSSDADRRTIDAHAWVSSGDVIVAGDTDLAAYTALMRVGAGS